MWWFLWKIFKTQNWTNKEKTKPKLILSNCYRTIWAVILQMGENITAKYLLSFHLPKNCVLWDRVVSVHKESAIS